MTVLLLFVCALSLVTIPGSWSVDQDDITADIDQLTKDIVWLDKSLQSNWLKHVANSMLQMKDVVASMEDSFCPDPYQEFKCGFSGQCIMHYLMCDGHADCDNGADEEHCVDLSQLFHEGAHWKLVPVYDTCSVIQDVQWDYFVTAFEETTYFPNSPAMQWAANTTLELDDRIEQVSVQTQYSYYNHARRLLVLRWRQKNDLVYFCYFDGIYYDRCLLFTQRPSSDVPCALMHLIRVKE